MTASDEVDPHLLTALTTEHFVLQTGRSSTISEANGRATIYLGALSSALVAFGFTADKAAVFQPFAGVVFPALLLLGWFTFVRMVQTSVEAMIYLTRIQRIRAYYLRMAPDEPWFADVRRDRPGTAVDAAGVDAAGAALRSTGVRPGFAQMLFTAASMVAALNMIVLGVGLVLLARATGIAGLGISIGAAIAIGLVAFAGQMWWQHRQFTYGVQAG